MAYEQFISKKLISKKYGLMVNSGSSANAAGATLLCVLAASATQKKNVLLICVSEKLDNKNLHSPEISAYTSIIAKEPKIRNILKIYQKKFTKKFNKVCIESLNNKASYSAQS